MRPHLAHISRDLAGYQRGLPVLVADRNGAEIELRTQAIHVSAINYLWTGDSLLTELL